MNPIKETYLDLKDISKKIFKRDFKGNKGKVIKNSSIQLFSNVLNKVGSLIFTIILARLLMPDLFGLYTLALSTILLFGAISELGIETTLVRFLSKEFNKNKNKVSAYSIYLGKIKIYLTFLSTSLLLIFANYVSSTLYEKPLFLALIIGSLFILINNINGFLKSMVQASNNFSSILKREVTFQISKLILVPLAVILALNYALSEEMTLMLIILTISFSLFLASVFLIFDVRKVYCPIVSKKENKKSLSKKEKERLNFFIIASAALVLSGAFFGNVDKIMLGIFVQAKFIGFYTAAFGLIGAISALAGFAPLVLLPIFSRLKGKRLEEGFKKSIRITLLISFTLFITTLIFAYLAILIAYGPEYTDAKNLLRLLSLLLLLTPPSAIYQSYHLSKGNPGKVAKLLMFSTILNILLNYFLISGFLIYGDLFAIYGAAIATISSQAIYLIGLVIKRK